MGPCLRRQLKRTLAEADGKAGRLIPLVGDVVRECEICRTFDVAPAIRVAGTSSASSFNEEAQVGILSLGDLIALHVLDLVSPYSLLARPVEESARGTRYLLRLVDRGFWEASDNSNGRRG